MKRWAMVLILAVACGPDDLTGPAPTPQAVPWDEIEAFYAERGKTPFQMGSLTLSYYPEGWYESVCDYSKLYADALMCGGGGATLAAGVPVKYPWLQTFVFLSSSSWCVANAVESRCVVAPQAVDQTVGGGGGGGGGGSWY